MLRLPTCGRVMLLCGLVAFAAACDDDSLPGVSDGGGDMKAPVDSKLGEASLVDMAPNDGVVPDGPTGDGPAAMEAGADGTTGACGNGALDPGEACDTQIAAGQLGACPSDCDDGQACTSDTLQNGGSCQAKCSHATLTQCKGGDGCCPLGCNDNNDTDCAVSANCGNGQLDKGETCDTAIKVGAFGACPTSCKDGNDCTADKLQSPGTCNASCLNTPIAKCSGLTKDGCCPAGCIKLTDADCVSAITCGNGQLDKGETCDIGIKPPAVGACPASCDDGNDCTVDKFTGSFCTLACSNTAISACKLLIKDNCCPKGCTALTDADCKTSSTCGDGKLDKGETCDTGIKPPAAGSCPTSCDDSNDCTVDGFSGSACTLTCTHKTIVSCIPLLKDKCCPIGCTVLSDADCTASTLCGNGFLDPKEKCDTGITPPNAGACPTSCDDGNACTNDTSAGKDCQLQCLHWPILTCKPFKSDGCCPTNCTKLNDFDCKNP
jgi:hypothetical protein